VERRHGRAIVDLLLVALLFALPYFNSLGKYPLLDPDEGRYAEIPREMLESGDYITPHLDYVKFFLKPPLFYWMVAASYKTFGISEFSARFPATLCGLLMILLTYHIARSLFGRREGLLAAAILGTSCGYFICSRLTLLDMPLSLFMTGALGFFLLGASGERRKSLYFHLFFACMAFSVLAKGLIGVMLPALIIFLYFLIKRRWGLLREMHCLTGVPLFLLISAPWFVLVSLRNPDFFQIFFIREHLSRFLTRVHGRHEPFGFYVPMFFLMMFPWSFFLPSVAARLWKARKDPGAGVRLFIIIWAAAIFIFFSLSESNLVTYIIPVFPAVAILIAAVFASLLDGCPGRIKWSAYPLAVVFIGIGAGGILYPFLFPVVNLNTAACIALGAVVMAGGITALAAAHRRDAAALFSVFFIAIYFAELVGGAVLPQIFVADRSTKKLALTVKKAAGPDTLIVSYMYEPSLAFYTLRQFVMVNPGDTMDLEFGTGRGGEPDMFLPIERLEKKWDSSQHIIALLKERDAAWLRQRVKTPVRIMARQGEKLIVTNR